MDDAGPPIATPSVCWWNSSLKIKNVVRSRNSSSSNIWSGNRFIRSWRIDAIKFDKLFYIDIFSVPFGKFRC